MAKVVAEIGCNHMGRMEVARDLILSARSSGADYVKFQKRNSLELLTPEEYNAPHPNPGHSYGESYGLHRKALEFDLSQHRELKHFCEGLGIGYSCSVWDMTSAREIVSLRPDFIKVPSALNLHTGLFEYLSREFLGEIHVSVGMTDHREIEDLVSLMDRLDSVHRLALYACTSGYPVPFDQVCLLEINRLRMKYAGTVKAIGFSGHHLGIAVDISALTLGAEWIERHFTLDRTWKGTDHAASLEPDGLRRLVRDVKAVKSAMKYKQPDILPVEEVQRKKLKRFPGLHF